MNVAEGLQLVAQLLELEDIAQRAATPAGRWNLLQDFLKQNPKWEKQVNAWIELTPAEALITTRAFIAKQAGIPLQLIKRVINDQIEQRAKKTIAAIQELYKARKQLDNQNQLTKKKGK